MGFHFREVVGSNEQKRYAFGLIVRQLTAVENLQSKLQDFAAYAGTIPGATTKLTDAADALEAVQAQLIEAIELQAAAA